jgi:hypothetical protein
MPLTRLGCNLNESVVKLHACYQNGLQCLGSIGFLRFALRFNSGCPQEPHKLHQNRRIIGDQSSRAETG